MQLYQLYLGTNVPSSDQVVAKEEIHSLLAIYPDLFGYTLIEVEGYWQGEMEKTFVLQITHPNQDLIYAIGRRYRLTFNQESVMVVLPNGNVDFIEENS